MIHWHWVVCAVCGCVIRKTTDAEREELLAAPLCTEVYPGGSPQICGLCELDHGPCVDRVIH